MDAHRADIATILSKRHDNGDDYWSTSDGRIYVGNPFSTIAALGMLHELGVGPDHEAVAGALTRILAAVREDGRIRLGPKSPMYPCYTAEAARTLCRFDLAGNEAVQRTISYLMGASHESGGWRCNFTRLGRGPETAYANPGATLLVLDVLRFDPAYHEGDAIVDQAVESLLSHWETRVPLGPCHYGIGTRFLRVEFPFLRYNLFFYLYVLSFFAHARRDPRFQEALATMEEQLDEHGQVVIVRPHRGLKGLEFCAKGQPSPLATRRFDELRARLVD